MVTERDRKAKYRMEYQQQRKREAIGRGKAKGLPALPLVVLPDTGVRQGEADESCFAPTGGYHFGKQKMRRFS